MPERVRDEEAGMSQKCNLAPRQPSVRPLVQSCPRRALGSGQPR